MMKLRSVSVLLLVLTISLCFLPLSALADSSDYTPYTAKLLMRMATREGPSTAYAEPGSFFSKGDTVSVISIAYDINSVPWVQVEFSYRGGLIRAYTGLKRVDIDASWLPTDEFGVSGRITTSTQAYRGPGEGYVAYDFTVPNGTEGIVYNLENGYVQFAYSRSGQERLVWVQETHVRSSRTNQIPTRAPATATPRKSTGQASLPAPAHVIWSCQPYAGPGTKYAQFDYLVYSGTRGTLYSIENGYAQFSYDPGDGSARRIVWLPSDDVELD